MRTGLVYRRRSDRARRLHIGAGFLSGPFGGRVPVFTFPAIAVRVSSSRRGQNAAGGSIAGMNAAGGSQRGQNAAAGSIAGADSGGVG